MIKCEYKEDKCWFKHTQQDNGFKNIQEEKISENPDVMQKIVDMMETFSQRLVYIENQKNNIVE